LEVLVRATEAVHEGSYVAEVLVAVAVEVGKLVGHFALLDPLLYARYRAFKRPADDVRLYFF
jgi:hypothetical protein